MSDVVVVFMVKTVKQTRNVAHLPVEDVYKERQPRLAR
jgi:hypothetical protein